MFEDARVEAAAECISKVIHIEGAYKAVKFLSKDLTVKATRKRYGRKYKTIDLVVTIGRPNYEERELIKKMHKAYKELPGMIVKADPKDLKVKK